MRKLLTLMLACAMASSQMSIQTIANNSLEDESLTVNESQEDKTIISKYTNGKLDYTFFEGEDGNIYMQEDLEVKLAIKVTETVIVEIDNLQSRAPSVFILQGSRNLIGITITADVIGAGTEAVEDAVKALIASQVLGVFSFKAGAAAAIASFAYEIVSTTQFGSYVSEIVHKVYEYNGCDWLLYDEFELPTGDEIGDYTWLDNPALGVAPYVCKFASQTYPY